ncbi:unnamed protein product [Bemisia tabaci]|uniref:Uncharacterized protein n=1 Tax=Bemisia tabaci TaxID=7038 RepID=A0A9N9ZXS0_BEMTA|nr:unnamed protein product [Bemisia tabaci]
MQLLTPSVGMFLGQGMKKCIDLVPLYEVPGPLKASALPGLHALSGADITGSFAHKGKVTWWKIFKTADRKFLEALGALGTTPSLTETVQQVLEEFISQLYISKTKLTSINDVRSSLFAKKQCKDENLPPTRTALQPA